MGYRKRYKRKYFDYQSYYADARLNKYFQPIICDIKHYFFSLPKASLFELMLDYKEKYGQTAYDYAISTMHKWETGVTKMSDQTMMRLVETLPHYLPDAVKYQLMEKLLMYFEDTQCKQQIVINTNWLTYQQDLLEISTRINSQFNQYCPKITFEEEMLNVASWLAKDDMLLAKQVLDNFSLKKYRLMAASAQNDIRRFIHILSELQKRDNIYNQQSLRIELPAVVIIVYIEKTKKSFMKSLCDFFK